MILAQRSLASTFYLAALSIAGTGEVLGGDEDPTESRKAPQAWLSSHSDCLAGAYQGTLFEPLAESTGRNLEIFQAIDIEVESDVRMRR